MPYYRQPILFQNTGPSNFIGEEFDNLENVEQAEHERKIKIHFFIKLDPTNFKSFKEASKS